MSRNYGLPYMGSKNRIAKELITELIEYQMPSDFTEILTIETNSRLNDKSPKKVKEKLFKYEN